MADDKAKKDKDDSRASEIGLHNLKPKPGSRSTVRTRSMRVS